jgi:RNA recognition motif-containing protein
MILPYLASLSLLPSHSWSSRVLWKLILLLHILAISDPRPNTHLPTLSFTSMPLHLWSNLIANYSSVVSTGTQQMVFCPTNPSYVVLIVTCLSIACLPPSRRFEGLLLSVWQGIAALLHSSSSPHPVTKVDACTIMRDPVGTSRGFAFMTFEDPNAVSAVVAREHFLDGKTVRSIVIMAQHNTNWVIRLIQNEPSLAKNIYEIHVTLWVAFPQQLRQILCVTFSGPMER